MVWRQIRHEYFTKMIVGAFSHLTRVDDEFILDLVKQTAEKENAKEIIGGFWGFSEMADCQSRFNVKKFSKA